MGRFLIDITRFISRIGRGHPTGIDRVETEYITAVARLDPNSLALAKLGQDFILLPVHSVVAAINQIEQGQVLGRLGRADFFRLKLPRAQRMARQYFRSAAVHSNKDMLLLLAQMDLSQTEYVNVGHSNLTELVLSALRAAGCAKISVMIHDMIPLDYPQFTKAGIPDQFRRRMMAVAKNADRVICNSADTQARVRVYFSEWESTAQTIVAHLGVEPMAPKSPPEIDPTSFVVLGTIEPRKNHETLFQAWEKLAAELPAEQMPKLHIVGKRGWNNQQVFDFMDTSPLMGKHIFEHADLGDEALANLIANSAALLFPSFAEGFGLPALEAAQLGVPVICSDLPVFHEILGGAATYLPNDDPARWAQSVQSVANRTMESPFTREITDFPVEIPRWHSHFRHVFGHTEDRQNVNE
nr:glycosyltransferase family 1 protein [Amylibacter sp.]